MVFPLQQEGVKLSGKFSVPAAAFATTALQHKRLVILNKYPT